MSATDYETFLASKLVRVPPTGMVDVPSAARDDLFPHQGDLTTWALRRGRAAVFANTGLGKSRVGCRFAHYASLHTGMPSLILAPCAVPPQTVDEGKACGVNVLWVRDGAEVIANVPGVYVTNYEKLHRFDTSVFGALVADESSVLKHHTSKTFGVMCEAFASTLFKLCQTATPAPNDWTELGTHAEFLGVCTRAEMLAEFFVHDGGETQKWRLKGHARDAFFRWLASWAALVSVPSDLGYPDDGYALPPLHMHEHLIPADPRTVRDSGLLFAMPAESLPERRAARRGSISQKVQRIVDLVRAEPSEQWVIWCELNDEQEQLAKSLGDECVSIRGTTPDDDRVTLHSAWLRGEKRILLSKCSIFGWGLNWQHCARMIFVGASDSWESYYQGVRRVYRFRQTRDVHVHVFASELEGNVVENMKRKDRDATALAAALAAATRDAMRAEIHGQTRDTIAYAPDRPIELPPWLVSEESP